MVVNSAGLLGILPWDSVSSQYTEGEHHHQMAGEYYSWIGRPIRADKKYFARKPEGFTTLLRPPLESSWRGESKSALTIFVKFIFDLFFQNNFANIRQRKKSKQIWICPVEYVL